MSIKVMNAVFECRHKELEPVRRMILIALADYACDDGVAWPSQERIAAKSGCSVRTAQRHIQWLENAGYIVRSTIRLGQGKGSKTTYKVIYKTLVADKFAGANLSATNSLEATDRANRGDTPDVSLTTNEPPIDNSNELSLCNSQKNSFSEVGEIKAKPSRAKSKSSLPISVIESAFIAFAKNAEKVGWVKPTKLTDARTKLIRRALGDLDDGINCPLQGWQAALDKAAGIGWMRSSYKLKIEKFCERDFAIQILEGARDDFGTRENTNITTLSKRGHGKPSIVDAAQRVSDRINAQWAG